MAGALLGSMGSNPQQAVAQLLQQNPMFKQASELLPLVKGFPDVIDKTKGSIVQQVQKEVDTRVAEGLAKAGVPKGNGAAPANAEANAAPANAEANAAPANAEANAAPANAEANAAPANAEANAAPEGNEEGNGASFLGFGGRRKRTASKSRRSRSAHRRTRNKNRRTRYKMNYRKNRRSTRRANRK